MTPLAAAHIMSLVVATLLVALMAREALHRRVIPITATGYRSHFLDQELLVESGGPVGFFLDWIEREARTRKWAKAEFKWRQLELFPR